MAYKTINVLPETYRRLVLYKHAGMSFNDVLNEIMDLVSEDDFYEHVLEEHRKRMSKIKAGEFVEAEDLDKALEKL